MSSVPQVGNIQGIAKIGHKWWRYGKWNEMLKCRQKEKKVNFTNVKIVDVTTLGDSVTTRIISNCNQLRALLKVNRREIAAT